MYKNMYDILNEVEIGEYKLDKFEITPANQGWRDPIPCGKYVRITNRYGCVMSNTPMEQRTNAAFVRKAHGDILIGGLGIGMILLAIQDKAEVRSITVIENSREIIQMVLPQLPLNNKVRVVQGDIFDWKPERGTKYDVIYFDIWNYINSDVYEEMKTLKNKYKNRLRSKEENPNRFMSCWAESEAKGNRRLY